MHTFKDLIETVQDHSAKERNRDGWLQQLAGPRMESLKKDKFLKKICFASLLNTGL